MTFSYNPSEINDEGLNQMRFCLGDCLVEDEQMRYLSNEEICAALEGSKSFKHAMLRLVESLLMRFAYETSVEIREAKWYLSDRIKTWQALHKKLKDELDAEDILGINFGLRGKKSRPPIFKIGMNDLH